VEEDGILVLYVCFPHSDAALGLIEEQAINFLNNMAFNVKLPAPAVSNGEESFGRNHVSEFIPMRRKLVYRSE
jgi:hypothetical protein